MHRRSDAEQALESATLHQAVIASAADAVMVFDRDGAVVVWNRGCEQLFGWPAEQMIGRGIDVLLPEDRRAELARVVRALDGDAEPAALETVRQHRCGDLLPVSCRLSVVVGADGEVVGVSAVVRDSSRELELRHQLEQTRHLAEARFVQSAVAQATLSADGTVVEVNPALCRLSGYEPHRLLGRRVTDFLAEADVAPARARLGALARGEVSETRQGWSLRRADGRLVETLVSVFVIRNETSGGLVRLEVMVEDISAAAAAQRAAAVGEARWRSLVTRSADVALLADADGVLQFATPACWLRFGYAQEQVVGASGFSFFHPDDEPGARAVWASVTRAAGSTATFDGRVAHADGSWRWVEVSLTNGLDDGVVDAVVVNLNDVTERVRAEEVLARLGGSDGLTGLPTRGPLMAALDAAFAADQAERTALAIVDLARFKLVNDTRGNRGGDAVLAEVADRLVQLVGDRGVVARVGGDRFAVLLLDRADIGEVFEICSEMLVAVEQPFEPGADPLRITARVGAALGPAVGGGALLASAESALQTAKQGLTGPMHVVRAESSSAAVFGARLVEDLRRGIAARELVVAFQPVVTLVDGGVVGAEALVRWAHPEKGLLLPGAFMEAAEDSGLVVDVGQEVLDQACRAAARWRRAGAGEQFRVAVNVSARQLVRGGLVEVVTGALARHGTPPQALALEVTESAVMSDMAAAVRTLQELRDLGVAIAVDDFGTGYSSLTYLKQFPVTTLKVDRSFISGLGKNSDDAAIVSSVVSLAAAMQLDCVAEGVETDEQRVVLQALGCTFAQGYLWSRPVDAAAFEVLLQASARRARPAPAPPAAVPSGTASEAPLDAVPSDVVARALALRGGGASPTTIAAALNAEGLSTPQGRRWTARSVAGLLTAGRTSG